MKLYLLSQNDVRGYDTYDSMVVCAESAETAIQIHPRGEWHNGMFRDNSWCQDPSDVTVEYLGEASDQVRPGIVCSSYHAG